MRFGFSDEYEVMESFDKKYQYLTRNKKKYNEYEALILYNHHERQFSFGNHMFHNENAESSIKEFVNRESISVIEDFNADTVLAFSLIEDPLLLVFADTSITETDKKETEHQRKFIDDIMREVHHNLHARMAGIIVLVEEGNKAIRDLFGVTDPKRFPYHPKLILFD
mmetsp:Transcript_19714/g.30431  ORF Transcript_19714/g.30431 Transcript_19714/m.30431 type:complete len:167 (+) Transcript_19714:979-1479(+)|eukprot:CAMPEP_0170494768 /NCGR_PEP_ID=MMETSP0208-20121228/14825_1 /TAXON_ID=197538 /ORGANISM="Strombidium inclinatum, Strain S3" /LENGTH=166 /DNA_ID=CAMNT_0010770863 /DNA_START=927 /DNA_END=1427 /DNA_ORIENTATION=+